MFINCKGVEAFWHSKSQVETPMVPLYTHSHPCTCNASPPVCPFYMPDPPVSSLGCIHTNIFIRVSFKPWDGPTFMGPPTFLLYLLPGPIPTGVLPFHAFDGLYE